MATIINQRYYIAPGTGGKMYVLRVKGSKRYYSGTYPYDRLVQVLGTDLEEAKKKAEQILGNTNFEVNDAPLKEIKRGEKDPDKNWKWQFGQYKDQDIRHMDWDNERVKSYAVWFWNANKTQRKDKDEAFFQNLQPILLEKGLIVDYNGELMTKKDYDWKKKREGWAEEHKKAAEKSDYIGNKGDKIRRKIKWVFTIQGGDTKWGALWITKFVDEEGNTLMLKGAYPPFQDKENFHDCIFTIKYYSDYKGEKSTVITRIKDLDKPKEVPETTPEEHNINTEDQYTDRNDYSQEEYSRPDPMDESYYPRLTK